MALLSLDDALALVLAHVRPLEPERVPLGAAAGRVLAEPVAARVDLPPFPSSAMDGFAVRAEDTPATLRVVDRVAAGRPASGALGRREAMEISTGGVVPDGADAVVPVEDVIAAGDTVEIANAVAAGANVRRRGGDVRAGDVILQAGTTLRPSAVGALAAAGVPDLDVARAPRVAIVSTGSELRAPGEGLGPGQIYEANSFALAAASAGAGAAATRLAVIGDDVSQHRDALELALEHDVVVTSGGVSVGPHDLVRTVASDLGVQEVFWRVAVKPGKPIAFGTRGETLVFGLPGNPVSALVGFELFVRPALRALQGADPGPHYLDAVLAAPLRRLAERDQLVRARLRVEGGRPALEPLTGQESHMIGRAAAADALALVRRGAGEAAAGTTVPYLPF
ncbi:MAG TPA: gephyrin-like molybdotransferase Glp [Gaiellaceae bacterium]|nr:gephyrin-like molybdotransferase Glp [Gaiellaceae bacterium]